MARRSVSIKINRDIDDIRGSAVYGTGDEKLVKIDDVILDSDSGQIRYIVVDTGGWLSSRRFLVPPDEFATFHRARKRL